MDQNSTNDTDKRNWRERLGIGGKDMPRISGEFTKAPEAVTQETAPVRPAQSVAKPAPMAPRLPMKAAASPAPRPQQQVLPQGAAPQAPDALAEKLRSQRAAAERLAEQRVTAAKQRAENASGSLAPAKAPVAAGAPVEKPKFSFADEDTKADFGRGPPLFAAGPPAAKARAPPAAAFAATAAAWWSAPNSDRRPRCWLPAAVQASAAARLFAISLRAAAAPV